MLPSEAITRITRRYLLQSLERVKGIEPSS